MSNNSRKLIVIVGPTASGKSALGVHIAKKIGGEIVSADSRQVYRGMNLGSGKITPREMRGIPHYLIDVVNPKTPFSAGAYQKRARKAFEIIWKKRENPNSRWWYGLLC
jgi:tRNA dimethylallyltransferase